MHWLDAWVLWLIEKSAGSNNVGGGWHDEAEMAVEAAAVIRMNGSRIGVKFFLKLADGSRGWFTLDEG
jgi:hypothetical protein